MLRDFAKAVVKDQYASETTNYMGTITQAFKQNAIRRMSPLLPKTMQTKNTWRACPGCSRPDGRGNVFNKITMVEHITGQISARKCHMCGGSGQVFG